MFNLSGPPVYVAVTEERYDVYGSPTLRGHWLFQLLKKCGGISDSVPPGWYDFNATRRGLKIVLTLIPHDE